MTGVLIGVAGSVLVGGVLWFGRRCLRWGRRIKTQIEDQLARTDALLASSERVMAELEGRAERVRMALCSALSD